MFACATFMIATILSSCSAAECPKGHTLQDDFVRNFSLQIQDNYDDHTIYNFGDMSGTTVMTRLLKPFKTTL